MNWELYLNTVFEGSNVSLNQISFMQVYTPYLQILATALSATPPTTVGEAKKLNFGTREKNYIFAEALMWWLVVDASVPHTIRSLRQIRQAYVEDVTYGQTAPSR
jgi:hypothetical protein